MQQLALTQHLTTQSSFVVDAGPSEKHHGESSPKRCSPRHEPSAECPPYTATASSAFSTSHSFWHFRHFRYAPRVLFDFASAPT